jgi:hypothetical protein
MPTAWWIGLKAEGRGVLEMLFVLDEYPLDLQRARPINYTDIHRGRRDGLTVIPHILTGAI